MFQFFEDFLKKMLNDFRRISRATKNEMTVGDLQSEAWIIADKISKRRGFDIDFSDPDDANLIVSAVYVEKVRHGDWRMRRSIRIDQDNPNDDHTAQWHELLPATPASDPLVSLLERESGLSAEMMLRSSFSQAAAYVSIFFDFNYDRSEICAYLVISNNILARRLKMAADSVRAQPSLFDRIEQISENFMAIRGPQYITRIEQESKSTQWSWEF